MPGNPANSLLIKAMRGVDKDLQMPPKNKLSAEVVADFTAWVQAGRTVAGSERRRQRRRKPGGRDGTSLPAIPAAGTAAKYERMRRELWSWQPIKAGRPRRPVKSASVRTTSIVRRGETGGAESQAFAAGG